MTVTKTTAIYIIEQMSLGFYALLIILKQTNVCLQNILPLYNSLCTQLLKASISSLHFYEYDNQTIIRSFVFFLQGYISILGLNKSFVNIYKIDIDVYQKRTQSLKHELRQLYVSACWLLDLNTKYIIKIMRWNNY